MTTATCKTIKKANLSDMKEAFDLIRDYGDILQRKNGKLTILINTDSGLIESDFSLFRCSKCSCMDMQDGRFFDHNDSDDAIKCSCCGASYKW